MSLFFVSPFFLHFRQKHNSRWHVVALKIKVNIDWPTFVTMLTTILSLVLINSFCRKWNLLCFDMVCFHVNKPWEKGMFETCATPLQMLIYANCKAVPIWLLIWYYYSEKCNFYLKCELHTLHKKQFGVISSPRKEH